MSITCKLKLLYRAARYRFSQDRGGILFIRSSLKKGQTALDVGAHKAGYLYFMQKKVGKSGKVFAFEPQPRLYEYILRMKALFGWQMVQVENIALSDAKGQAILYVPASGSPDATSPGATIVEKQDNERFMKTVAVETETLDSYCSRMKITPDFLKIDVEGQELAVLTGGLSVLKQYKPRIHIEIEIRHAGKENADKTIQFLMDLGYKGYFIRGGKQIPVRHFSFDRFQNLNSKEIYCNNFVFV